MAASTSQNQQMRRLVLTDKVRVRGEDTYVQPRSAYHTPSVRKSASSAARREEGKDLATSIASVMDAFKV